MQSKTSISGFTRGFTLIELLITVVVFTVIMAIALPVYQGQVREARRSEARTLLLDAANREQRFFADSPTSVYTTTLTDLGFPNPAVSDNGNYVLSAAIPAPAPAAAGSFRVTATAQGSQAADTACATLSLDSTGAKSSTGGGDCW